MDKRSLLFVVALTASLFLVQQWFNSRGDSRKQAIVQEQKKPLQEELAAPSTLPPLPEKPSTKEEEFFVLENDYQQLVFSTKGGAIAEINLPLRGEKHPKSPILPIAFDKVLAKNYPQNDRFPAYTYSMIDEKTGKLVKKEGSVGGYYPLLRRPLFSPQGDLIRPVSPQYYAFNCTSQDPETAQLSYRLRRIEKNLIEFESLGSNRRIIKTYRFASDPDQAPYCIDLGIKIEGDARNLWMTSGVPEVELISGSFSPALKYRLTRQQKAPIVEQIDLPKTSTTLSSIQPDWVCNSNGFLGLIIDPLTEIGSGFTVSRIGGELEPTRLSLIDPQYKLYPAEQYPGYEIQLALNPSKPSSQFRIFAGPFLNNILAQVDKTYSDTSKNYNPDYVDSQSYHGWFSFISEPFAKFLFILMKFFYKITSSWGISIILLTIALRIMLYPLNTWSIKSSAKLQQIAPLAAQIQERNKKEPKRGQMEIMALYKEKGVNPLSGCFPLLIQMPFLIGMFDLLKSAFELRGASFIPGWIDNLSAPDVVFSWSYPIIFFGTSFHLLPLILGAVMYIQQRYSSPLPKDKSKLTDQQKQQKLMGNIMVIVFAVMFYHFPSGLNIYWLSSMLLGILQQWWTVRQMKAKQQQPATPSTKGTTTIDILPKQKK